MRKRIYKLTAVLMAFAMIFCNNSIISLAEEIVPEKEEDVYEEVLEEDAEEDLLEAEEKSENVFEEEELPSEEDVEESTEIEEDSEAIEEPSEEEVLGEEMEEIEEVPGEEEITESSDDVEASEEIIAEGENIASGTSNNVSWVIDANGKLTISGTGDYEIDYISSLGGNYPAWCQYLENITSAEVNLSGSTNMSKMFYGCENLVSVKFDDDMDTSEVTDMSNMFSGCKKLETLDLSVFSIGSNTVFYPFLINVLN